MLRSRRNPTGSFGRARIGASAMPVLITAACFLVVVGALFFAKRQAAHDRHQVPSAPQRSVDRSPKPEARPVQQARRPADRERNVPVVERVQATDAGRDGFDPSIRKSETHSLKPVVRPAQTRVQRLQAQLEAGEFGPALETAGTATDAIERTRLLSLVADAQMEAGEFDGALLAIGRIPIPERRREARGRRAVRNALAGGGSQADFTQLKELIMANTSGPWEEEGGEGGTMEEFETGVRVDPNGLLYRLSRADHTGRLDELGIRARTADLNDDMARSSSLRLVSLTRLEKAIAARFAEGQPVVETMKHLAGLSRVRYVFVYPDVGEIVIGGPAEGWRYNENGLPVGVQSGRPTLWLDDLVTVLRTFSHDGLGMFNCLIVPRPEGLKALERYVARSNARGPLRPSRVSLWVKQLTFRLGLQDVQVNGVPVESRVARVIVEADYRMKLIGVGKLDGGKDIRSFFDLLPTGRQNEATPLEALRWWLTMKYDAVLYSPDRNVFEILGPSVLCQSENEFITAEGKRVHTGKAEETNRLFAQLFTKHYAELARRDLVFADLQNIFDLALVAALVRHERLDERVGWNRGVLATGAAFRPERFEPAKTVMSVAADRVYRGKDIVVQVAGGVRADLMAVLRSPGILRQADRLQNLAEPARAPQLPEGRWWWDQRIDD